MAPLILVNIVSSNSMSPAQSQAITWTNTHLVSTGPSETKFSNSFYWNKNIFIQENAFKSCLKNGDHLF